MSDPGRSAWAAAERLRRRAAHLRQSISESRRHLRRAEAESAATKRAIRALKQIADRLQVVILGDISDEQMLRDLGELESDLEDDSGIIEAFEILARDFAAEP